MRRSRWLLIGAVALLLVFAAYWNTRGDATLDLSVLSDQPAADLQVVVHPMTMMKMSEHYDPLASGCLYGERTGNTLYVTEAYFDGACAGLNALGSLVMLEESDCTFTEGDYQAVSDGLPIVGVMCGNSSVRFYDDKGFVGEWK